jgi:hypothetical protein
MRLRPETIEYLNQFVDKDNGSNTKSIAAAVDKLVLLIQTLHNDPDAIQMYFDTVDIPDGRSNR